MRIILIEHNNYMGKKSAVKPKTKNNQKVEEQVDEKESDQQFPRKEQQQVQKEEKFSLYKLLNLPEGPKSTLQSIKKQYRLLAMTYHPDKNIGDDTARQKFQKVKEAYDILSDPQKKKMYDETGIIGQDMDQRAFETAYEYFRAMAKKIQLDEIEQFQKSYRGGDTEQEDLLQFYANYGGDMTCLLENIPCSKNEDVPRFIEFYEEKFKDKTIKRQKIFDKTKNKVRMLPDQSREVEMMQKQMAEEQQKLKNKEMNDLVLAIRNKPKVPFWEALEEKYSAKPKKAKAEKKTTKSSKPARRVNKKD